MKLPKNTTLLTREKLHSVDWCPLDIMIFDIESRVINTKYQGCSIFSVEFEKIRGYDEKWVQIRLPLFRVNYLVGSIVFCLVPVAF